MLIFFGEKLFYITLRHFQGDKLACTNFIPTFVKGLNPDLPGRDIIVNSWFTQSFINFLADFFFTMTHI